VTAAIHKGSSEKYPSIESLFDDVYDVLPRHLEEQREELREHLKGYSEKYPFLSKHEKE